MGFQRGKTKVSSGITTTIMWRNILFFFSTVQTKLKWAQVLLGPHFVFFKTLFFYLCSMVLWNSRKTKFVEFFYWILLGLLFSSFCVIIGSYYVIVWFFSSSCLSFITLLFDFWVNIQISLGWYSEPISWISYCCLAPFTLLFDFFWVAIWFWVVVFFFLFLLSISSCCDSNFLLLFNTSTLLFDPMLFNSSPSLKYLFYLVCMCDSFSLHYCLTFLVMLLINQIMPPTCFSQV